MDIAAHGSAVGLMLGRALKMAFWVLYDHLGKLVLANLCWSLAVAFPGSLAVALLSVGARVGLLVGVALLIVTAGVVAPVGAAGLAYMAKVLIETRDGAFSDFWIGIRKYWGRAAGIGLLFVVVTSSLVTSVWFYAHVLGRSLSWLGYGISGLAAWCLVLELLTSLLAIPTLVQKGGRLLETIKLAGLLVLDNPFFVAGLAGQVLALTVLLIIPPIFFLLYGAAVMVLISSAYEMLARKYTAIELSREAGETGQRAVPPDDSQDDYLNRGFRDFLFPWKG